MTISATRFKALSEETNVAIADLSNIDAESVLNSPNNLIKEASGELTDLIQTETDESDLLNKLKSLKDEYADDIRDAKGVFGKLKDLSGNIPKSIEGKVGDLFPAGGMAKNAFSQLASKCKTSALGRGGLGKPYDPSINCNGKNRNATSGACNTGQYSDIINKLTGGAYNSAYNDANSILGNLMALAGYGYNMNMCGVFGALSGGIGNTNLLTRASAGLWESLSTSGNTFGIFDLAGASAALNPGLEFPEGVSTFFSNYKMPGEIKEFDYSDLKDRISTSMDSFEDGWDSSEIDDLISTSKISSLNDNLGDVFRSSAMENFNSDDMSAIVADDFSFFNAATQLDSVSSDSFGDWF